MPAVAELTASQTLDRSVASVGEPVSVIVVLSNNGAELSEATVTPGFSPGIAVDDPGMQSIALYPGVASTVGYSIRPEQSGTYLVSSLISYTDAGMVRQLNMVSQLNVQSDQTPPGNLGAEGQMQQPPFPEEVSDQGGQVPGQSSEQDTGVGMPEHMPGRTSRTFLPGPSGLGPGSVPERDPHGPKLIE